MSRFANGLSLIKRVIQKIVRCPAWFVRSGATLYRRAVHQLVLWLTDRYWLIDYLPKRSTGKNSVLLIRFDLIGDFVIWLDAAKEFKHLYPNKHIVLYAHSSWASLAEQLSYWDQVIAVDIPRLRSDDLYRLGFLIKTHRCGFAIAIQPTYSREYVSDLVVRATQAGQRIAHFGDRNNITLERKLLSDTWYTRLVPSAVLPEVELTVNAELIRRLGHTKFKSSLPILPVLQELPARLKIEAPYCVIVPGASWAPKIWPVENFAIVARQVHEQHGLKIVLCGTVSEQEICQKLALACGCDVTDFTGQTMLIELVELIRQATLVITNDSASVHIAAATNTQAICILGGGHYGRFLPYQFELPAVHRRLPRVVNEAMSCYGCYWRCQYLTETVRLVPCVSAVSPERVMSACDDVLTDLHN
jgi:ADP-heptose:LPS heptosyltransferase